MSGRRIAQLVLLAVVALAVIVWFSLRAPDPLAFAGGRRVTVPDYHAGKPTGVPASLAGNSLIERGEYLTRAADCVACHTGPGGTPYAGGLPFKLPFGTLYSPNITPDVQTGIGSWSDEDFVRALHDGVGKGGKHLYPAFPYTSYTLLTREDVLAIKAYLFSLAPVHAATPANDLNFPFNQRYLMVIWNGLFNPSQRFRPDADQTPAWNRGAYLAEALGHCGECHTPRNFMYARRSGQKFGGAVLNGWKAYNVTSDPQAGIGAWPDEALNSYLATGRAAGYGAASGPMAEALEHSLRYLTPEDTRALTAYLRTVPPIRDTAEPGIARKAPPSIFAAKGEGARGSLGQQVFAGACAGCHRWDGTGAQTPYAALLGSRAVNDPEAINLTQVVLQGSRLRTAGGELSMPGFGQGYSDSEIAAVANFVTERFGARASEISPAQIADRRAAK